MAVWIDIGIIFFLYCSVTVSTFSFAQLGKCYYHSFANFFELGYRLEDCSYIEKCVGSIMDCAHLCLRENGQCRSVNFDQTLSNEGKRRFNCQLNNSTKEKLIQKFVRNPSFDYLEPKEV